MSIKLQLPKLTELKPRITVFGVGGAGGNAVNNMIASGLAGVEFVVANTDAQALLTSSAEQVVQLGINLTEGLGAGARPEIGEAAAEEALDDLRNLISGSHMIFIACGMGGGTGTGAASVIARIAREMDILTVGIVTKPFQFEGSRRMRIAEAGIEQLRNYADTLIVIPNQNLFRIASEKTTFAEAFILADQVLYSGIACIVDLIVKEGLINLDFADVRAIMKGMGSAMMGTGEGEGERRAIIAAEEAIANPLLDGLTLQGARGLLLSIVGGGDLTLYEVDEAASRVREEVDADANIIVGASFDESLGDRIRVSIVASGMNVDAGIETGGLSSATPAGRPPPLPAGDTRMPAPDAEVVSDRKQDPAPVSESGSPAGSAFSAPAAAGIGTSDEYQRLIAQNESGDAESSLSAAVEGLKADSNSGAAQNEAQGSPNAAAGSKTPLWQAPGDVTIEASLPQLNTSGKQPGPAGPGLRQPPPPHPAAQQSATGSARPPAAPATAFTPAPPQPIDRPMQRMPRVEDFPAPGQRDYHAKTADASGRAPAHPVGGNPGQAGLPPAPGLQPQKKPGAQPQKKKGFFERLRGRGEPPQAENGTSDSHPGSPASYPQTVSGAPGATTSRQGAPAARDAGGNSRKVRESADDVDLPMFFGNGKPR